MLKQARKVLVVDDEFVVRDFLKEALSMYGFEVYTAKNTKIAKKILSENRDCKVVLCDIKMPEKSGVDFLKEIKEKRSDVITIMITGYASWESITESIRQGAYDYIKKPFNMEEMVRSIERAVERNRLENENIKLKLLLTFSDMSKILIKTERIENICNNFLGLIFSSMDLKSCAVYLKDNVLKVNKKVISVNNLFDWDGYTKSVKNIKNPVLFAWNDDSYNGIKEIEIKVDRDLEQKRLNVMCLPLIRRNTFFGMLFCVKQSDENGYFTYGDIEFLKISAYELSVVMNNICLYNMLDEKVKKLNEARENLAKAVKLASAGELAAGIAHEIGNPLFSIRGTSELLLERKEKYGFSDEVVKFLRAIKEQAERAQKISKDLMTFARQEETIFRICKLDEIVNDTISLVRALFEKDGIKLEIFSERDIYIYANYGQISQVLFNLLMNSKDAIKDKGDGLITISLKPDDEYARLSIKDNGCGMDRNIIDKIFFPFFTTKDSKKGHGLGLSICHGIIEKHNGKIEVYSEKGKGSEFIIFLPIIDKEKNYEVEKEKRFEDFDC